MPPRVQLTHPDLDDLPAREKAERRARVRLRLQALRLVAQGQLTNTRISEVCGVTSITLRNWTRRFNEEGFAGLEDKPGRGRKHSLSAEQIRLFEKWVEDGPEESDGGFNGWTALRLCDKIQREFGIEVCDQVVYELLARLGFRHRKARKMPSKADIEELLAFKKKSSKTSEQRRPRAGA